jgi:hypothetical protein
MPSGNNLACAPGTRCAGAGVTRAQAIGAMWYFRIETQKNKKIQRGLDDQHTQTWRRRRRRRKFLLWGVKII